MQKGEKVDPIDIQINLTGFLERNTPTFMAELWRLLISAQNNYSLDAAGKPLLGVPQELLEEKKAEIITQRVYSFFDFFLRDLRFFRIIFFMD